MPSAGPSRGLDALPGRPTLVFPERFPPAPTAPSPDGGTGGEGPAAGPVRGICGSRVRTGKPAGGGRGAAVTSNVHSTGGRMRDSGSGPGWGESQAAQSASSFAFAVGSEGKDSFEYAKGRRGSRLCSYLRLRLQQLFGHVEPTPALTAAKTQRTPCGVNRYVLLGVYFFYAFLTARVYFAWPSLSNMLFRSNAYVWLCDPGSPDLRLPEHGGRRYRCEAQNSQVGSLFVTCLTFAFSCSLLAGVLLDFFGPKITALTGQLCNMLAWLLLAFAGEHAQTYFPAFIFMGIGSDIGYLPVLSSANLFPGHEGLVVACLGAAKSLSFAIPAILDSVELHVERSTLQDVSLGYVAFGPGLCVLLSLLLIPLQAFLPWNEYVYLEEEPNLAATRPLVRVNDSFASYEAHAWRDSFSSFQDVKDWMHHHHLATPLEELTHSASAAALPPLRGPLLGAGVFASGIAPDCGGGGGEGGSSSSTALGQGGGDGIGGVAGPRGATGCLLPSPRGHVLSPTEKKGKGETDSSNGSKGAGEKEEEGTGVGSEALRLAGGGEPATFGTSVSTEAVFALSRVDGSGSSSADTSELHGREPPCGKGEMTQRLQHPGTAGREAVAVTKEEKQDAATGADPTNKRETGKGRGRGREERGGGGEDGGNIVGFHRLVSVDTSAHSPATAAAAAKAGLGAPASDLDEAAAGEEIAAATTGSETVAAADEDASGVPEAADAEEEEDVAAEEARATPSSADALGSVSSSQVVGGGDTAERLSLAAGEGRSPAARTQLAIPHGEERRSRSDGALRGVPGPPPAPAAAAPLQEEENATPSFRQQFFSKFAFGIVFYSVLKALMYAFFTTGGENLLGKRVNDFLGAALPFSCIPCIFLGKVVDIVGIMPVLLLLNTCITLAYGFSMIPSTGTAYLGALLYICYVSFYSSQSYCYVSDTFSSCHFGKLVGTIHMIAGLLSLLKIPMQSMVVHVFHSNYLYPCVIMLVFCAANFAVLIWLVILKRRDPHPFWPQSARDAAAAERERRRELRREQDRKRREMKQRRRSKERKTLQKDSKEKQDKEGGEEQEQERKRQQQQKNETTEADDSRKQHLVLDDAGQASAAASVRQTPAQQQH